MTENAMNVLRNCPPWNSAYKIQRDTIARFHEECAAALDDACDLRPLDENVLSHERNLFSTLFVMATATLGLTDEKVRFYALVNQCLRALVTGCDNILDDEYKEVIPFDLPGDGIRFRSVLKIMTADAVLAKLIATEIAEGRSSLDQATRLSKTVLGVLIPSGIEEHEEESCTGVRVPTPEEMLDRVHFVKTGLLFQAPLTLVHRMGDATQENVESVSEALAMFGIGCQILDDMKDIDIDLTERRYNLVISTAFHGDNPDERDLVSRAIENNCTSRETAESIAGSLTDAIAECRSIAMRYFMEAHMRFANLVPEFGLHEAEALGELVRGSIMKNRNDLVPAHSA